MCCWLLSESLLTKDRRERGRVRGREGRKEEK